MTQLIDTIIALEKVKGDSFTESDTRAVLIDPLIAELGWLHPWIQREPYAGWSDARGFIDYLLLVKGKPLMVVEAKKYDRSFQIPIALAKQKQTTLGKLLKVADDSLKEALEQCIRYTQHCGALYACATNGRQYIFFKPFHVHRTQPEARVVLFDSFAAILSRLDEFEALFSRKRLESGSAEPLLIGKEVKQPAFARRLQEVNLGKFSPTIEAAEYSRLLDQILPRYLLELRDEETFGRCYVPVEANRVPDVALEALVKNHAEAIEAIREKKADFVSNITDRGILPGDPVGRTVILHGGIGVGKTSFLRNALNSLQTAGTTKHLIWARTDLRPYRDRAFDGGSAHEVVNLICKDLRTAVADGAAALPLDVDPEEWRHLRDIYNREARQFQKERYPGANDGNPSYVNALQNYIWDLKQKDPQDHLVRTLRWLTVKNHVPIVLVIDNSDQLGVDFQELLYKLADHIQQETSTITVLVLRTEALVSHRLRAHRLASVQDRYEIIPAPTYVVLRKRMDEIIKIIRQENGTRKNPNLGVAIDRLTTLIESLSGDAAGSGECARIIDAVGNGSIRRAMEAVGHIFRLDPQIMDRLVAEQARHGTARIQPGVVLRGILRAGRGWYRSDAEDSLIPNILLGDNSVEISNTLGIRILREIRASTVDEPPSVSEIVTSFGLSGESPDVIRRLLLRFHASALITVAHMNTELSDEDRVRISRLGEVVIDDFVRYKYYIDAVAFDSFITSESSYIKMRDAWRDSRVPFAERFINVRNAFVEYLHRQDEDLLRALNKDFLHPPSVAALPFLNVGFVFKKD